MRSKKGVLLVASFLFSQIIFCGFSSETLVRAYEDYVSIGQLEVGDIVDSFDLEGSYFEKRITHKRQFRQENCLCLIVDREEIITSQSQKFFLAGEHTWKSAKYLKVGDIFLGSAGSCGEI